MFHRQVVSFDWYLPYSIIKTKIICIFFPWLISSSLYTVILSLIFVNSKMFFLFSSDGALLFTDSISRQTCIICILLLFEETTIFLWRDTFRVWMTFLNVILKAVFIHICMIMFYIRQDISRYFKVDFCRWYVFYMISTISLWGSYIWRKNVSCATGHRPGPPFILTAYKRPSQCCNLISPPLCGRLPPVSPHTLCRRPGCPPKGPVGTAALGRYVHGVWGSTLGSVILWKYIEATFIFYVGKYYP